MLNVIFWCFNCFSKIQWYLSIIYEIYEYFIEPFYSDYHLENDIDLFLALQLFYVGCQSSCRETFNTTFFRDFYVVFTVEFNYLIGGNRFFDVLQKPKTGCSSETWQRSKSSIRHMQSDDVTVIDMKALT